MTCVDDRHLKIVAKGAKTCMICTADGSQVNGTANSSQIMVLQTAVR